MAARSAPLPTPRWARTTFAAAVAAVAFLPGLALPAAAAAPGGATGPAHGGLHGARAAHKAKAPAKARRGSAAAKARAAGAFHRVADDSALPYGERDDLMRFADDAAARRDLDPRWVRDTLAAARLAPASQRLVMPAPAGTAKNWAAYRMRFVEPVRIAAGAAFWNANREALARAEQRYGVPPAIVVGILGVETIYGRQTGGFRVLDVLVTLGFDFPSGRKDRSAFFRDELEQFLLLCRREGLDPLAVRGSFAGAMGLPQFMPSSINRHAVDFDGDGRIDLNTDAADAIGSVAHYLASFGWQRGLPTHLPVAAPVDAADRAWLLGPDIVPSFTGAQFAERGARLFGADGVPPDAPLALVELQNGDAAPSYVAGTANFYAITRYNWSSYYAMAVIELGAAVEQALARSGAGNASTGTPAVP